MSVPVPGLIQLQCPHCNNIQHKQLGARLNEGVTKCHQCKTFLAYRPTLFNVPNHFGISLQVIEIPWDFKGEMDHDALETLFENHIMALKQAV